MRLIHSFLTDINGKLRCHNSWNGIIIIMQFLKGYQSLSIQKMRISLVSDTNPDVPQGTVAYVSGMIYYEGGIEGTFSSTLEKVNDKWQIYKIDFSVPPGKIK